MEPHGRWLLASIRLAGRMPFRRGLAARVLCRLHSPRGRPWAARRSRIRRSL